MISFSCLVVFSRDQMFKGFTHLSPLNITKAGFLLQVVISFITLPWQLSFFLCQGK